MRVGDIENRGYYGRNFVFYDLNGNKVDVWSELSPIFKGKYTILTNSIKNKASAFAFYFYCDK